MLQGFYRSNFAILGIPLINSICGENVTGLTYLMVAVVVPLFSILAVVGFEVFKAQKSDIKILSLIAEMIKTPLIIGCLLGLIFFLFNIKLPFVIEKSVSDISKIATPLAIVAIGGSFTFRSIKGCIKEVAITVFLRLVFIPLVAIIVAVMMGFRGEALACLLITFGGPVSISSFSMAQQMGGDEDVAANVVIFSSLLCILTMFCWIFALNMIGLF
jgi:predicted permease